MLKKTNRNLNREDFKDILSLGRLVQTPFFGLRWIKSEGESQWGWIISKKISKKAVIRNSIKRKIAAAVKKKMIEGVKGVFLVKKEAVGRSGEEMERTWEEIREKVGA